MQESIHNASTFILPTIHLPTHWPAQGELLNWCRTIGPGEAALLIMIGVIYLLFGQNLYRFLVMINMAVLGLIVGAIIGQKAGDELPGAITGAAVGAALTFPFLKYCVALIGGLFGLVIGAGIWRASAGVAQQELFWAGGLCGCLFFGLLAFVIFKICVMTYTSLQGAGMIVLGGLVLLLKYPSMATSLTEALNRHRFILPLTVFIPTLLGLIYQHSGPTMVAKPALPKK
jgi:hypothetical protein